MRISDWSSDVCSSDLRGLDLETLALALRRYQRAAGDYRAAGGEVLDLVLVVGQRTRRHHLDRGEAGAVADVDEAQPGLGIAPRAHPAANRDFAAFGHLARQGLRNTHRGHALNPCSSSRYEPYSLPEPPRLQIGRAHA